MNLMQFEYFRKVAERKSMTLAAKELFITQPAVSKQIRLLEEEFGCRLFLRKSNRLTLSPAGEFLYERIRHLMNEFHDLPVEMNSFLHRVSGKLRIGCGPYTSGAVMPDLIAELVRRYPQIEPSVQEKDSFQEDLREGRLDIMFGVQGKSAADLAYVPMYQNRLILIASNLSPLAKARKITPELLESQPFLAHSYDPIRSIIFSALPGLNKNRFCVESRYTTTLICYVQKNLGFSIIPDYYLGTLPPGVVAPEFATDCVVETGFLVNPARPFSPPLRMLMELVREKFGCPTLPVNS